MRPIESMGLADDYMQKVGIERAKWVRKEVDSLYCTMSCSFTPRTSLVSQVT